MKEQTESQALTVLPPADSQAVAHHSPQIFDRIADPIAAVETLGGWFARSGMFGCEKPEQGQILALAALCERKSPLEIADTYHLVGGRLTMKSRAILAKYRQAGGKVKWVKTTDTECLADWTFEGEKTRIGFTFKEAERMGVAKPGSGWQKNPAEMLRARATTRAITMLCPEILIGGGVEDDLEPSAGATTNKPAPVNPIAGTGAGTPAATPGNRTPQSRSEERAAARQAEAEKAAAAEQSPQEPQEGAEAPAKPKRTRRPRKPAAKPAQEAKSTTQEPQEPAQEPETAEESASTPETDPEAVEGESEPIDVEATEEPATDPAQEQLNKATEAIEEGVGDESPFATVNQLQCIMDLVGEQEEGFETAADTWLVKKGWITGSGEIKTLSKENAQRILDTSDRFIKAVCKLMAK